MKELPEKIIYVDNNATTKVAPEVFQAMEPFFKEQYGNPSSMHHFGGSIIKYVEQAREKVASLIKANDPSEIIFTSGGTESDNSAIISAVRSYPGKKHIITSKVEHPAVLNLCKYLETTGYRITYLDVDFQGMIDLNQLKAEICDDTVLITLMYANNETGVIFPVEEIAEIGRQKGVLVHTDAVQALGKIDIDLNRLPVSLLSLSGHKIHAPKGVGALYVKKGTRFWPLITGGHQEKGRRGGTENVASIVGLGKAAELEEKSQKSQKENIKKLRDDLEKYILEKIPGTCLNGHPQKRLINTANISFKNIEGEAILLLFDEKNIAASSGSACTSGSLTPSHVLRAMDIPVNFIQGSVRFSLSRYNSQEDINYIKKNIIPIIEKLRRISPFKD